MLILALDTSGDVCSVALSDGDRCRAEYNFRHDRRLIERLPGAVQFVLSDAGVKMNDVEAFAVGLGPGSFTGVRVGVTMAKVWAMTAAKPVVGVSSLDVLAEPLRYTGLPLVCIAPTRHTESVAAFYAAGSATPLAPPAVLANAAIITLAQDATQRKKLLLAGEITQKVHDAAPPTDGEGNVTVLVASPLASAVARLAYARLLRGESDSTDTLVPLYVTPPPTG